MKLNRRNFIKWSMALGGTGIVGSLLPFKIKAAKAAEKGDYYRTYDETKWAACTVNCGARCPIKVRVKDGRIVYLETDNEGDDIYRNNHQVRACIRGRSNRFKVYGPNRLKYPMKRVGARGEGKFEKISWEEAFDIISNKMKDIKQRFGNDAFYINYGTGTIGGTLSGCYADGASVLSRLMNCYGGYLNFYDDYSTANIENGLYHMFGDVSVTTKTKSGLGHPERAVVSTSPCGIANDFADIENSKLVVMFGNNPCETKLCGGSMQYYFNEALERGKAKLIVIDPRYTDSAANKAHQWIPIRPATDGALVAGLAYVMIKENLVDQKFLDKYCVGFDRHTLPKGAPQNGSYKDYVMGTGADKTPKTPEWASNITGIPVSTIIELAREIGTTKPVHISQGWGPQRNTNGEQIARAICTLAAMSGCIGIKGGNTGSYNVYGYTLQSAGFPQGENKVKATLPFFLWTDAIVRGPEMTDITDGIRGAKRLKAPIKFLWSHASNTLVNQHADVKKTISILKDESLCEMIVDVNITMTPSSRYSDILLPDATPFEQIDQIKHNSAGPMPYIILTNKSIEPLYDSKPVYDIAAEISKRLGIEKEFTQGRTQEQWVEYVWNETRKKSPDVPDYQTMLKKGIYKRSYKQDPYVALKDFRDNPTANPLATPSGKIEIYSTELQNKAKTWILPEGQKITPIPEYLGGHDTYTDTNLRSKYPYQLNGFHFKGRCHSSFWEIPAIRELNPQEVWINPIDAAKKGVKHGDLVELFNDRGKLRTRAKVTQRVMPGVLAFGQGAWYRDKNGIDIGGCVNVLTSQEPNPISKGNAQHTALIDFKVA